MEIDNNNNNNPETSVNIDQKDENQDSTVVQINENQETNVVQQNENRFLSNISLMIYDWFRNYLKKFVGLKEKRPPRLNLHEYILSFIGSFISILTITLFHYRLLSKLVLIDLSRKEFYDLILDVV